MASKMDTSEPTSPAPRGKSRPQSMVMRPHRSQSRMSVSSRNGRDTQGTRYSDEDGKTAVKVG